MTVVSVEQVSPARMTVPKNQSYVEDTQSSPPPPQNARLKFKDTALVLINTWFTLEIYFQPSSKAIELLIAHTSYLALCFCYIVFSGGLLYLKSFIDKHGEKIERLRSEVGGCGGGGGGSSLCPR